MGRVDSKFAKRRAESEKSRHTFHVNDAVMEKLRDAVYYIQQHPTEFKGINDFYGTVPTLSTIAEKAMLDLILALEKKRGKAFPKRPQDEGVHFGRPRDRRLESGKSR